MPRGSSVLQSLLRDERIAAFHKCMANGSLRTADGTVTRLGILGREMGIPLAEIRGLATTDPRKLEADLTEFVAAMRRKGRSSGYVVTILAGLRAWLKFERIPFDGFPRVAQVGGETVIGERVPTVEELQRLVDAIPTARGKVVALLMAHAGLRPGTLGFYKGGAALRLRNLPELDLGKLEFRKVPFIIEVPGPISKNRRAYATFGSRVLADRIVEYLRERRGVQTVYRRKEGDRGRFVPTKLPGEKLGPDSPLVTGEQYENLGKFVSEKAIMVELTRAIERTKPEGVSWVPYVLRSFCSTRLWEASMIGLIDFQTREAVLGHNAGVSALYSSRRKLEASTIEKMRESYSRCEPYLWTGVKVDTKRELIESLVRAVEESTGGKNRTNGTMSADELVAALKRTLAGGSDASPPAPIPPGASPANPARQGQRLVGASELDSLLRSGAWRAVMTVGDRVVVEPSI